MKAGLFPFLPKDVFHFRHCFSHSDIFPGKGRRPFSILDSQGVEMKKRVDPIFPLLGPLAYLFVFQPGFPKVPAGMDPAEGKDDSFMLLCV